MQKPIGIYGARERTRNPTALRPLDPECISFVLVGAQQVCLDIVLT